MKIKFLANYPPNAEADTNRLRFGVNLAYFYLKHFYELHGKNTNVEWQMADLFVLDDFDTIIANIEKNLPDILALSVFIWNETLQYKISKTIKERYPNIRIVVGGPQIAAHKNKNFFSQHPYIDYVVYGDGERAFQQIIDFESKLSTDKSNWVNIVENANSYTLYPFEQLVDQLYFTTSPILNQQQFVIDHIRDLENKGVPRNEMFFAVEFARGCMYNCTFCDWSQNLTKKVKRRSLNWQEEINFWHQQDVAIRETDANFGQWNEDIEIFRYAMSLYDPSRNFRFIITNTPKLRKDHTYEMLQTMAEKMNIPIKISLQDINKDVLDKMERPSLSWDEHKSLIHKLQKNLDPKFHNLILAELMVGVAGQTYDGFTDTIKRIIMETGIQNFFMNHWMLLPSSKRLDFTKPVSTTTVTPSMVREVSAMSVASTIFRFPLGWGRMARCCSEKESCPNKGTIRSAGRALFRTSSAFRISPWPGRNTKKSPRCCLVKGMICLAASSPMAYSSTS